MSEIKKLLEADTTNIAETERFFANYSPELPSALDEAAALFVTFSRAFSQQARDDEDQRTVNSLSKRLGICNENELQDILRVPLPNDPEQSELLLAIRTAMDRGFSRRARGILLILAFRSYMFAVTDLLRQRMTPAFGHIRIQIEAVGLMTIMRQNPVVALEWMEVSDNKSGKQFFRKYSNDIWKFSDRYELTDAWNLASGAAQHARFLSVSYGLKQSDFEEHGRRKSQYQVVFQEGESHELILWTLFILLKQYHIFLAIREALPEVVDPILINSRLPNFRSKVQKLWRRLEEVYPEEVAQWKKESDSAIGENADRELS